MDVLVSRIMFAMPVIGVLIFMAVDCEPKRYTAEELQTKKAASEWKSVSNLPGGYGHELYVRHMKCGDLYLSVFGGGSNGGGSGLPFVPNGELNEMGDNCRHGKPHESYRCEVFCGFGGELCKCIPVSDPEKPKNDAPMICPFCHRQPFVNIEWANGEMLGTLTCDYGTYNEAGRSCPCGVRLEFGGSLSKLKTVEQAVEW